MELKIYHNCESFKNEKCPRKEEIQKILYAHIEPVELKENKRLEDTEVNLSGAFYDEMIKICMECEEFYSRWEQ